MRILPRGEGEGWVLEFPNPDSLMRATQELLTTNFTQWEVIACYPCKAVQLSSMRYGVGRPHWISLTALLSGLLFILLEIAWIYATQFSSSIFVIPGQEVTWERWASYMPALFVAGLLGAGIGSLISFLMAAGLPRWYDWIFEDQELAAKASSNGFFIVFGGKLDEPMLRVIASLGASHTKHITQIAKSKEQNS